MTDDCRHTIETAPVKVAAVTLGFWIAKVAATTLGETGGDWVTMSLNLGYLVGTGIFAAIFVVLAYGQVRASRFHPALYWATIVATTTVGTTMADFFFGRRPVSRRHRDHRGVAGNEPVRLVPRRGHRLNP